MSILSGEEVKAYPMTEKAASRIPSLDGLRAVSIILVLWSHAMTTREFPGSISPDGALGVRIFFVISGFIITTLLLAEEQKYGAISLMGFYRRRAARILPALVLYLSVVATLGLCGMIRFNVRSDFFQPLTFTMGFPWWPRQLAWEVRHTWSLSIEEQFYLVWPVLVIALPKMARLIVASTMVVAGPLIRVWIYQHPKSWGLNWMFVGHADVIAWGCLIAIIRMDYPRVISRVISWRRSIARLAAIAVIQFAPWYFWESFVRKYPPLSTNALSISAQAAAVAFLILSLVEARAGKLYAILNYRAISTIGVFSYGLYLWQQFFFSNEARWWNGWPVNLIFTIIAAIGSYYAIEQPIRRFARG